MPKSVRGVMHEWRTGQLHSGSSAGPVVKNHKQAIAIALSEQRQRKAQPKRALHPALKARSQAVKAAHAHLTKTLAGFRNLPGHQQIRHTQAHVKKHGY